MIDSDAAVLMRTTFYIEKMDCSAEEQLVRMKLAEMEEVKRLDFNLPERQLTVYHTDNRESIGSALKSLRLGLEELEHEMSAPLPPESQSSTEEKWPLVAALAINAFFFIAEFAAGLIAGSMGLVADALDMLADASVYSLSLMAVGGTMYRKKQVARWSGYFQLGLAILGLVEVGRRFMGAEAVPDVTTMIVVAALALVGNVATLLILSKTKREEAHMQASWIFTSNDIKVNLLVIASGVLVFFLASRIPDLITGAIIFVIVARGARQILALSR